MATQPPTQSIFPRSCLKVAKNYHSVVKFGLQQAMHKLYLSINKHRRISKYSIYSCQRHLNMLKVKIRVIFEPGAEISLPKSYRGYL